MANKRPRRHNAVPAMASSLSVEEGVCDMCCHETKDWAVGKCDHPTCLPCSTKLRLLCEQKECPVCRLSLKKVLMVRHVKPFISYTNVHQWRCDRRNGVFFQNQSLEDAYYALVANKCKICLEPAFRTFKQLRDHMSRAHNLLYCEICTENLKLFPCEFKTYTRKELVIHRRDGDKDDTSHKGHPLCQFCDERYLDNDHLHIHLRKNHFWCHFCESDGKQDYFPDYVPLRRHFKTEHFLCEEGQCRHEKFTSVFRTKLDLQAHRASAHTKGLSKAEVKQLKQLDVGFSYGREREDEEPTAFRRARQTGGRGGADSSTRGGRSNNQTRSREVVKPKPTEPPNNPPKTSPMEETKAPPGFERQPPLSSTISETATFITHSSSIAHDFTTFDPYGVSVASISETLDPVPAVSSGAVNNTRAEPLVTATNPPPGFGFSKRANSKPAEQENEWPDLTTAHSTTESNDLFPLSISNQPVMGNITSAVMNANKVPSDSSLHSVSTSVSTSRFHLLSESSFPSLLAAPTSSLDQHVQSESSFPTLGGGQPTSTSAELLVMPSLEPPRAQQSKLLKFAVAATNSDVASVHSWSSGSGPAHQVTARSAGSGIDLSSQHFPPMTTAVSEVVGGDTVAKNANQNDRVTSGKVSPSVEKKSKQSQVIEKVRKALGYSKEQFTHFKTLMGWYKNGEITVNEFKAQCVMLFGNRWREIGPELAEVMPTHEKKNELLSSFGISAGVGKSTVSAKSRKRAPVSTPSVWGSGGVEPVRNFNSMYKGLSSEEYPSLSAAATQPKVLPQPTPWNVVI